MNNNAYKITFKPYLGKINPAELLENYLLYENLINIEEVVFEEYQFHFGWESMLIKVIDGVTHYTGIFIIYKNMPTETEEVYYKLLSIVKSYYRNRKIQQIYE